MIITRDILEAFKNISKPGMPLTAYHEMDAFKVYTCDTGLLRRLAKLPADVIASPSSNYVEFKGGIGGKCSIAVSRINR